jgi:hypothetical protein
MRAAGEASWRPPGRVIARICPVRPDWHSAAALASPLLDAGVTEVVMNQRMNVIAAACAALALGGCYAYAEPPTIYAEASEAPVEIDVQTYPRAQYEGRPVYLYHDRWYYREGSRWHYYRREPAELHRQRSYVQQAPPARRDVQRPLSAPPARREY